jgi:hypothetical protein
MSETMMKEHAEVSSAAPSAAAAGAASDWWQQLDQRIYQCIKL